ncbi:cryptochrome/photolyase family protein [Lampropedia aestuarii]|uniref:cryptochrome/photolyase family protein n=1 Tax=Lampropedia aestuarii TaxID=2562762 RepID=UPI0024689407|nr:deoxyribodipyrimidine photo-lyase [Lampropedia aestuarii]MDH5856077.1 deoxyribodipyrimidine photo-lyase [Lampropedia aestuarii]
MREGTAIFWFRRDLRVHDNAGLYEALKRFNCVIPVFVFDTGILAELPRYDRRVDFIAQALEVLDQQLRSHGSALHVGVGEPTKLLPELVQRYGAQAVYTNGDYEPDALQRDAVVERSLASRGVTLHRFKDQVVFEKSEVVKDDASPYTVFTPFSRKWKKQLTPFFLKAYPSERYAANLARVEQLHLPAQRPDLASLGFERTDLQFAPPRIARSLLAQYGAQRDFPAVHGTSRLGIHLRFGTGSIRALAQQAIDGSEVFLNELIWREFFQTLLWHFPKTVTHSFKPAYDNIVWRNNEADFKRWCEGQTGYPLVDAGMRELNATGFMHNRVRMVVASFLCKHLLIDWRWGERYFAKHLLDYELAANVGNWQWAAGSGADAAPYFRVFNPTLQAKKFDPDGAYVRQWVPEFGKGAYPAPMVEHTEARARCLQVYQRAVKEQD